MAEAVINRAEDLARNDPPAPPAPVRIRVPASTMPSGSGPVSVYDGNVTHDYLVKNGELEVDAAHAPHVIAALPGSTVIPPESPASKQPPGTPAKESK